MDNRMTKEGHLYPLAERGEHHAFLEIATPYGHIGPQTLTLIAGPCAIENHKQFHDSVAFLSSIGIRLIRAGLFKPRTSPYTFQGMGLAGLSLLKEVRSQYAVGYVTEILDPRDIEPCLSIVDIFQVGARNCQNYALLKELSQTRHPILLKRGGSCSQEEWLGSAEYLLAGGNPNVILCERGIRTFETERTRYRNTLDINVIPLMKERTHLPIFVDPSHASGNASIVPSLTCAAVAAGADGVMVDIHPAPQDALCDGPQSLTFSEFTALFEKLKKLKDFIGKNIS